MLLVDIDTEKPILDDMQYRDQWRRLGAMSRRRRR